MRDDRGDDEPESPKEELEYAIEHAKAAQSVAREMNDHSDEAHELLVEVNTTIASLRTLKSRVYTHEAQL